MIIEHNKKVKLNNPTSYPSGSKTKPNPTLGKSTSAPQQVHQHSQDETTEEPPTDTSTQTLVNKCLAESGIDPTDIQNVMSVSQAKRNISSHESSRQIQTHQRYVFAMVNQTNLQLIDRGANGGLAGADMRVLHTNPREINIVGIDDHELKGLNVVTAATLLDTQKGPIIGVFHEYAHFGKGRSIHAAGQMEWFNCTVDDRSQCVGGAQHIQTSEGYVIPLSIESGLVYMHSMRIPTDHNLQNYPTVLFTSPDIWDTSVLDHGIPPSLPEAINPPSADSLLPDPNFDAYRDTPILHSSFCDLPSLPPGEPITHVHMHKTKTSSNFSLDPPQGEDQPHDLTADVFVYGRPNLDEFDNPPPPCPPSMLLTYWGEPYSHQWMRMGRGTNLISLLTKDHMLPQTQNIMGVPTTYFLNGRLGSKHGKQRIITSGRKLLFMTRNTSLMHQRDTRKSEYTLYLMSSTVENSRLDL